MPSFRTPDRYDFLRTLLKIPVGMVAGPAASYGVGRLFDHFVTNPGRVGNLSGGLQGRQDSLGNRLMGAINWNTNRGFNTQVINSPLMDAWHGNSSQGTGSSYLGSILEALGGGGNYGMTQGGGNFWAPGYNNGSAAAPYNLDSLNTGPDVSLMNDFVGPPLLGVGSGGGRGGNGGGGFGAGSGGYSGGGVLADAAGFGMGNAFDSRRNAEQFWNSGGSRTSAG